MSGTYYSDSDIANLPDTSMLKRYSDTIKQIAAQTSPYASGTNGYDTFLGECQAWLPTRSLPYYKKTPGDCPNVTSGSRSMQLGPGAVTASIAVGGQVAGVVGKDIAGHAIGAIPIVGGILSGVASIFMAIFQHHAVAVADEQTTLCSVSNEFQALIPQIDSAVASGQANAAQGTAVVQQLVGQLKQAIDQRITQNRGNSGSNYKGILDAHALFAARLYQDITPLAAVAAPGQPSVTAPASSDPALAGFTSALGYGRGSIGVSGSGFSWGEIGLIAAVLIAMIFLIRR